MSSTSLLGRCTISAVHKLTEPIGDVSFYRAQGVALPSGIIINHFAYSLLEKRSKQLVSLILLDDFGMKYHFDGCLSYYSRF